VKLHQLLDYYRSECQKAQASLRKTELELAGCSQVLLLKNMVFEFTQADELAEMSRGALKELGRTGEKKLLAT